MIDIILRSLDRITADKDYKFIARLIVTTNLSMPHYKKCETELHLYKNGASHLIYSNIHTGSDAYVLKQDGIEELLMSIIDLTKYVVELVSK